MTVFKTILLLCLATLLNSSNLFASTIYDTLYINRDTIEMGNLLTNRCVFNRSNTFDKQNAHIDLAIGDMLELTVFNTDTLDHEVSIVNGSVLGSIGPGANSSYSIPYSDFGTYGIKCSDIIGDILGAFCVVRVGIPSQHNFIWNMWETNDTLGLDIGHEIISQFPTDYKPNISTINGLNFPITSTDTLGHVTGNIGDTIYISIVNSGNMVHTLHFHGYHVMVKQIAQNTRMLNWSKDTVPFFEDETATVVLVPDQEGMYPVHDHNLISVLTVNTYPGGMITMLNIAP